MIKKIQSNEITKILESANSALNIGNLEEAEQLIKKLLSSYPNNIKGLHNLATIFFAKGKKEEAFEALKKLLEIDPLNYEACHHCVLALCDLDKLDDALFYCNKAIKLKKECYEIHFIKAQIYQLQKKYKQALLAYREVRGSNERMMEVFKNAILVSECDSNYEAALEFVNKALEINFTNINLCLKKGELLIELGRYEESRNCFFDVLKFDPKNSSAYNNLGTICEYYGDFNQAIKFYQKSISIKDDDPKSKTNLALCQLREGEMSAWKLYENRLHDVVTGLKDFNFNLNNLDNIKKNNKILVKKEQGLGDQVFFGRYLDLLYQKTNLIDVEIDARLIELFKRTFPNVNFYDEIISEKIWEYDQIIPLGSLPGIFIKSMGDLSNINLPALQSNKELTLKIENEIKIKNKIVIGISWKTSRKKRAKESNLILQELVNIFLQYDISLLNLQYGDVDEEINNLCGDVPVINYKKIDNFNDIDGLVSLIDLCDLIITIDNSTAHLSSALGKETWVLLPLNSDYRWGLNSEKSCYYKKARLFRNKKINDWTEVLKDVGNNFKIKFKLGDGYEST